MKNSKNIGNVHSIEHFGSVDGPGIRYVLFLQGCPFKCKYCHNRDTWSTNANQMMTVSDVLKDFEVYKSFYQNGGITVSGGEPTRQIDFVIELFKEMKHKGIHTAIDTSAACYDDSQKDKYLELLEYTDLVLLDIKQINNQRHLDLVGSSNVNVLKFACLLDDIKKPVVFRYVLVPGYTDDNADLIELRRFLDSLSNIVKIEVLPYHDKGKEKWKKLGYEYPLKDVKAPDDDQVKAAINILANGYKFKKYI